MTGLSTRLARLAFLFVATAVAVAGCSDSATPTAPTVGATVSSVAVTSLTTSGMSFQATATARMSDGTTRDATSTAAWSSSNLGLATVSSSGMVSVVGGGQFDIRATYQGVTGSLNVSLATVPVSAVTIDGPSTATMPFQLTAAAHLSDGSVVDVTRSAVWLSSNMDLATVTTSGYVRVVAAGEVELRATFQGVTGSVRVALSLPRMYILSGSVTSSQPNGRQVEGARIQIFSGVTDHTVSDTQGLFAMSVLTGRAVVEVSMDGFQTWSSEIFIFGDTDLTVVLSPIVPSIAANRDAGDTRSVVIGGAPNQR